MNNFFIYSIAIVVSLALFYSAYWLFLRNETFFKTNRVYLIASVVFSLLAPLINIGIAKDSFVNENFISPIEQYKQKLFGKPGEEVYEMEGKSKMSGSHLHIEMNTSVADNVQIGDQQAKQQPQPLIPLEYDTADPGIDWPSILFGVYLAGAAFFLIRFIVSLVMIFRYTLNNERQEILGMTVIRFRTKASPFSFMNLIFISSDEYPEAELARIISHEKVHIRQKHSLDLILIELLLIFQWFNPFVWLYKRAVTITHEYLADQGVLSSGLDLPAYQYSLLNHVLRENNFEIASNYNLLIKKRIQMMMKKRSSKLAVLKLAIALPVLAFLLSAFTFTSQNDVKVNVKNEYSSAADTLLKQTDVPLEYLKMIEGEYVATNDPNRKRTIKFVEVLGVLIGNDAGYRYKIIPQGNGKFINPEDGASLMFDTKDKNAISLLLFEKINLKKVKETGEFKKSAAFLLAESILKEGETAAISRFKEVKDSPDYNVNDKELSFVGEQLMLTGKTKEAAAVFKLTTELFPESYKVFDTYGNALKTIGDKSLAIENYKKAIKLNPGSRNSLKALKELGINTDTLVKKVKLPLEYLKELEGEYQSVNDPSGHARTVKFMEEEGVLVGNDNGYRYKLIPMGGEKFINPDDGVAVVFNSKDKKAISVLIFGVLNFNKVGPLKESDKIKKVNVPVEDLKILEGEYKTINGDRTITIKLEDGVLHGTDNGYRYKLIPQGDGKFINPDDGAPLAFDTRNKKAINLLLFGTINLKKIK